MQYNSQLSSLHLLVLLFKTTTGVYIFMGDGYCDEGKFRNIQVLFSQRSLHNESIFRLLLKEHSSAVSVASASSYGDLRTICNIYKSPNTCYMIYRIGSYDLQDWVRVWELCSKCGRGQFSKSPESLRFLGPLASVKMYKGTDGP